MKLKCHTKWVRGVNVTYYLNGALDIKTLQFFLKIILAAIVVRDEDEHDDGRGDGADGEEA